MFLAFASFPLATLGQNTIVGGSKYETTPWAVTHVLPGGRNTPFTGIPVPSMLGADHVQTLSNDITIPGLNQPFSAEWELTLLNETALEPFEFKGEFFDVLFNLDPNERSFISRTMVQTSLDDGGPAPEGPGC